MLELVKEQLIVNPVVQIVDLAALLPAAYRHAGPWRACVTYWVHQPDSTVQGGFQIDMDWLDPSGELRLRGGTPIGLDHKNYFSTDYFMVRRQAPDADPLAPQPQWRLLFGVANPGSAQIGYSVSLGPAAPTDLIQLP